MMLPKRANRVGGAARGSCASITPALPPRQAATSRPSASISALMPVGVERMIGKPLLDRAQPRLGEMLRRAPAAEPGVVRGVEDEVGPVAPVDDLAGEDDLVAELEADLAPAAAARSCAGPGPAAKSRSPGRQPRQADRGEERPHRQIFAIGDEVRLVVAADGCAPGGPSTKMLLVGAVDAPPSADVSARPPVSSRSPARAPA